MSLFDVVDSTAIDVVPLERGKDALLPYLRARKPVLLTGVRDALPYSRPWNYQYFRDRLHSIRVQHPSPDGIYHYLGFDRIPMDTFDRLVTAGQDAAYALEPLKGKGVAQTFPGDLHVELPDFIPEDSFRVSNLYVGAGGNRSLLHYDETHSLLMMIEGRKRFMLFPPDQSRRMYPYGVFNIKALREGRVIDSRIDCSAPDLERFPALKDARGVTGWLEDGQALLMPAGTWHYIEAEGLNVSVNYFWFQNRASDWLQRPLIQFWMKRRILDMIDVARKCKRTLAPERQSAQGG